MRNGFFGVKKRALRARRGRRRAYLQNANARCGHRRNQHGAVR